MSVPWPALTHACAAAAIALTAMPRPVAQQVPAFRGGIDLVTVGVTVTDRTGVLVADLGAEDFEIQEDGRTQTISYFLAGDLVAGALPSLHVGVLLDVSESMAGEIGFARTAAIKFLNALERAADMTVVDFDTEVRVGRFGQGDFPRLVERIRQQKVGGLTALYDAIGVYLDGAAGQDGRTIMLLYTDGGDTRSALSLSELMQLLKASDATVYAIGSLANRPMPGRLQQERVLRQIAEVTGGQAFFPMWSQGARQGLRPGAGGTPRAVHDRVSSPPTPSGTVPGGRSTSSSNKPGARRMFRDRSARARRSLRTRTEP